MSPLLGLDIFGLYPYPISIELLPTLFTDARKVTSSPTRIASLKTTWSTESVTDIVLAIAGSAGVGDLVEQGQKGSAVHISSEIRHFR